MATFLSRLARGAALLAFLLAAAPAALHAQGPPAPPGFTTERYPELINYDNFYEGSLLLANLDGKHYMDVFMTGLLEGLALRPSDNVPTRQFYYSFVQQLRDPPALQIELHPQPGPDRPMPAPGVSLFYSDLALADYDGNGTADLLLMGATTGGPSYDPVTRLYAHNGGLDFTPVFDFEGLHNGSADWGDYDNDGDLDLLLTGLDVEGRHRTLLYRNDTDGATVHFTPVETGLPEVAYGDAAWGDYDRDGDLDVAITGALPQGVFVSAVYRNDGGVFTDAGVGLRGLTQSRVQWLDADGDGLLDLVLAGGFLNPFILEGHTGVYRNLGDGRFEAFPFEGQGVFGGDLAVGDLDADGLPDLLVSGRPRASEGAQTRLYRREDGVFREYYRVSGTTDGTFELGDYEGDGDLDVFITGFDYVQKPVTGGDPPATQFYLQQRPNTPPVAPENLRTEVSEGTITFVWDPAQDAETPAEALTYNLRIGTFPGGGDVVSALIHPDTGVRTVSAPGNVGPNTAWRIEGLEKGAYFWSVQAVDASYAASAFAEEQRASFGDPNDRTPPAVPLGLAAVAVAGTDVVLQWRPNAETDLLRYRIYRRIEGGSLDLAGVAPAGETTYTDRGLVEGQRYFYQITAMDESGNESDYSETVSVVPGGAFTNLDIVMPGVSNSAVGWADYDRDGDLDYFMVGAGTSHLYFYDGETFLRAAAGFSGLNNAAAAWGDYDGDGDLDLVLSGSNLSRLYRNDTPPGGQSAFSQISTVSFPVVIGGSIAWGDYDGDGDLDLVLTGSGLARLYRNDTAPGDPLPTFVDAEAGLQGVSSSWAGWGDYDNDGDLDLLVTGGTGADDLTVLYDNAAGVLTPAATNLPGIRDGEAAWGDYDNDGDLDLALAGSSNGVQVTRIFRNDTAEAGRPVFTDLQLPIPGLLGGSVAWGDYDNDGDLDLLRTGSSLTWLFRNDDGMFQEAGLSLPGMLNGAVAWGDYEDDGDLDLLITGATLGSRDIAQVLRNNANDINTPPSAPSGLAAAAEAGGIVLSWEPAEDDRTPAPGLTYNLRVGTEPGRNDVVPSMASADGYRHVATPGNAFHSTSWRLRGLPAGTYYWSVQAVDASFKGSPFTEEQSFTVSGARPETPTAEEPSETVPERLWLGQSYPNPFAGQATIDYGLPEATTLRLAVYDVLGRRVRVLEAGTRPAGRHVAVWDGRDERGAAVAPGLYVYRLETGEGQAQTRTVTVLR